MTEREDLLAKAAQDFIDKVDRGAARSEQSYAAFKAALTAPQALAATPAPDDDIVPRLEDHGLFNKAERNALFKEAKDEIVRLRTALAATPAEPIAWRWRTLPKFSEDAADQEWELTPTAPSFINPHHHEVEPLYTSVVAATPAVGGEALTDEIIDLSLSEFWDVSPRGWNEAQRVAMRKAILTAQPASPLRGRETPYVDPDFDKAGNRRYWEERNAREAAASPPEQPAAAPVFECPDCGKDIADQDEPHAIDCERRAIAAPATGRDAVTDRNLRDQLCEDCPPIGYPTDETRCLPCPRRDLTRVDLVRFGEPVWPNNDEANDLDKGSDA